MSAKNNVNPDHYKTGGRGRPGDNLPAASGQGPVKERRKKGDPDRNFIPGQPPVGEQPPDDEQRD